MDIFEPLHQITIWENDLKGYESSDLGASTIMNMHTMEESKPEYVSHELTEFSGSNQEANCPVAKVQRRLEQNREAARKSRIRKKTYVRQLETSCLKLMQLEQELEREKQQGLYVGNMLGSRHPGLCRRLNPGIALFETEYAFWVGEQQRQNCELRNALQAHTNDIELNILVECCLNHYYNLFRMKSDAAKADIFYLLSGTWRSSAERLFHWIGGFRPSDLLKILMPSFEPLTDEQQSSISNLRQSSQQAEYALSQGVDKLHQALAQSMVTNPVGSKDYASQMADAMEKFEALESFVSQADHLRQQTLQRMSHILTTQQAACGLIALGEYFYRLRALSSLWDARTHNLT